MKWYAVYTNPRAEKKAHAELSARGIEAYLPLQRSLKQWSDRKKWVEEPLFKSYLFVHISQKQYYEVLQTPGIVRYITFEGQAVPIPENQIEAIRYFLSETGPAIPESGSFTPGDTVVVTRGPMHGLPGEIVAEAGKYKVRVEIATVGQSILVTIPYSMLKKV